MNTLLFVVNIVFITLNLNAGNGFAAVCGGFAAGCFFRGMLEEIFQ